MSILLFLAATVTPQPGTMTSFTNWTLGCDNVRSCRATSFMEDESEGEPVILSVARDGQGAATPILEVFANEASGAFVTLLDAHGTKIIDVPDRQGTFALPLDASLWKTLRNMDRIEVRDRAGKSAGWATLKGMTAALRAMDDRQKRVGTVTALVATGPAPARTVPAPPALPVVTYRAVPATAPLTPTAAEIARMRKETGCTDDEGESATAEPLRADAATTIVLLSCGHGAYNFNAVPLVLTSLRGKRSIRPAPFDYNSMTEDPTGDAYAVLTNTSWDDASARLTSYSKGRGLGDCGTVETYVWDGLKLRLIEYRSMGECRGAYGGWPTLWRADARRVK